MNAANAYRIDGAVGKSEMEEILGKKRDAVINTWKKEISQRKEFEKV